MSYLNKVLLSLLILLLSLAIIHYNGFDLNFQALFYNKISSSWLVDRNDQTMKLIFYKLPKYLLMIYGIIMIIWLIKLKIYSKPDYKLEKTLLFLICSLIFVPLIIASLKHYSPLYCPNHIINFGGWAHYISLFDALNEHVFFSNTGKCFPAGHASGGFSLISLFFVMPTKKSRYLSLSFAIFIGWTMGFYQIAKGAHFLSDTLTSMILAYIICLSLHSLIFRRKLLEISQ